MEIEAHARLQVTVYSVTCLKMKTLYFTDIINVMTSMTKYIPFLNLTEKFSLFHFNSSLEYFKKCRW